MRRILLSGCALILLGLMAGAAASGRQEGESQGRTSRASKSGAATTTRPAAPVKPPVKPPSSTGVTQKGNTAVTTVTANYVLLAWSELGMHCMDGKDYSIFSVLPPFNTVHAQLIRRGARPTLVSSGVVVTYEAVKDTSGSINTTSATKTNFWDYVRALFLNSVPPNVGLANKRVQSLTPQPMDWNQALGVWEATGIPIIPYDDSGKRNAYPMVKIVAKDTSGHVLAQASIVAAVSDEMNCLLCHASGANPAAMPSAGWENNADPAKDVKLNILRLHDQKNDVTAYLSGLASKGYNYSTSLHDTALSGTPILCAACHGTNALGAAGFPEVESMTVAMHKHHAPVVNPATGTTLDNATTPFASCYLCHPGVQTRCQRGAMTRVACYNCHGNLTRVADPTRVGWLVEPSCQMCHNSGTRYATTFDTNGAWRTTSDVHFATTADVPAKGFNLYRFSAGHGKVWCGGCHGAPHAEFPTAHPNDAVLPMGVQNYNAKLTECGICHTSLSVTPNAGPHGMHILGQAWVDAHHDYADSGGYQACAYCHGSDYRGTALSTTRVQRTFRIEDNQTKTLMAGFAVSCYDCHNGPTGGD